MKTFAACLLVVIGTFLWIEAATAAPAEKQEYCATLGANVPPTAPSSVLFTMHARGCWEYYGGWKPAYVKGPNSACNVKAYRLATEGKSTEYIEARVTHGGRCFQFEDGTYGKGR